MSARSRSIKQMEKRIFYRGITCPQCQRKLTAERVGRAMIVVDAVPMIDVGVCRECAKLGHRRATSDKFDSEHLPNP